MVPPEERTGSPLQSRVRLESKSWFVRGHGLFRNVLRGLKSSLINNGGLYVRKELDDQISMTFLSIEDSIVMFPERSFELSTFVILSVLFPYFSRVKCVRFFVTGGVGG